MHSPAIEETDLLLRKAAWHAERDEHEEARRISFQALQFAPQSEAVLLEAVGHATRVEHYYEGIQLVLNFHRRANPSVNTYRALGRLYRTLGRQYEAELNFRSCLRHPGVTSSLLSEIAAFLLSTDIAVDAVVQIFEREMSVSAPHKINLSVAWGLFSHGRLEEAAALASGSVGSTPECNLLLAEVAILERQTDIALRLLAAAGQDHRFLPHSELSIFLLYLSKGDHQSARMVFEQSENRVRSAWGHGSRCQGRAPRWMGFDDLRGKTILVHSPVGYGDAIQYCRHLRHLGDLGAVTILDVRPSLLRLFRRMLPKCTVIVRGDHCQSVDYECDLRELMVVYGGDDYRSVVNSNYLDPARSINHARECSGVNGRCARQLPIKVGICWRGSERFANPYTNRAIEPVELKKIFDLEGLEFHVLQKIQYGDPTIDHPNVKYEICDVQDFYDTFTAIEQVDVVITVDTALAHLAGAMGKRGLLMLPFSPSWRWSHGRPCQIYQSLHLVYQAKPGDWSEPIRNALQFLLSVRDDVA